MVQCEFVLFWKIFEFIASVDIERVVREMDFQTLQQNIFNVAFCNIDAEVSISCKLCQHLSCDSPYRNLGPSIKIL